MSEANYDFRAYYDQWCSEKTGLPKYPVATIWYLFQDSIRHTELIATVSAAVNRLCMMNLEPTGYNVNTYTDHLRPDNCSVARWRNILKLVMREGMPEAL
jgi:hypothetical protein